MQEKILNKTMDEIAECMMSLTSVLRTQSMKEVYRILDEVDEKRNFINSQEHPEEILEALNLLNEQFEHMRKLLGWGLN